MSGKKKLSAFSVYSEQRSQQKDEEDGATVCVGMSSGSGEDVSGEGVREGVVSREGVREGVGSREGVREGVGSREGVGMARKRKKKAKLRALLKKRRRLEGQREMESVEEDAEPELKSPEKPSPVKKLPKKTKPEQKVVDIGSEGTEETLSEESERFPVSPQQLEIKSVDGGDLVVPFSSQFNQDIHQDSREAGRELFRLLINPFPVAKFFDEIWEQRPLFLSRHKPQYNEGWFTTEELDRILRENFLEFSVNIDITSYQDGERDTLNQEGRAVAQVVWDYYKEGCSVRLLNPQTYSHSMWLLTATLQEHFQSFVGANVYLTPAGTQGFAPHSDDIEAFVIQLEGKKRWKLYSPRESSEVLPRFSSPNLSQEELHEPILDVVLEPGDLLYFPRGTFHQAESLPDVHSMHVTLSTYQKYTWGDMMTKLMSVAMEKAMRDDVSFRQGLPLGCLNYTGSHTFDHDGSRREEFMSKLEGCVERLFQQHLVGSVGEVMDQIAAENVHSSLPPCLSKGERGCSVEERGYVWRDGRVEGSVELTSETEVKLARYNAIRLITDDDGHMLYYNQQNSRVFQEKDLQAVPLNSNDVKLVERLIDSYPEYIEVGHLCDSEEDMELLYTLFSHSIILIR